MADITNGNGRTKEALAYLVTSLTLAIGLGALGHQAISTVDENRKASDETLHASISSNRFRIEALEGARVQDAYQRGVSDQTLRQLEEQALNNKQRIEAAARELDDKLQRELRLADDTLRSELHALDKRLQDEIARARSERVETSNVLQARLIALEELLHSRAETRWTRADQERFEAQLGLTLEKRP